MSELINAKVIDGFTRSFLAKKYDSPKPINVVLGMLIFLATSLNDPLWAYDTAAFIF